MVHYYRLELEVTGPMLTRSSLPGESGLDAVALRDHDGSLLLNGKHMEGRAKHAAYDLAELSGIDALKIWARQAFGPDNPETEEKRSDWEPVRGDITFEDLRCCFKADTLQPTARDYRLQIDEARGTGEDRMLAIFERVGEHGETLKFSGPVRIAATGKTAVEDHINRLLKSLRWITSVGGEAGIGYGVVQGVRLMACATPPGAVLGLTGAVAESVEINISFYAPFCLAAPQLNQNIYEGLETVPGNAIAGAIMRAMQDAGTARGEPCYPELRKWFDRIRFRHAFPSEANCLERPIVVPLSWVSVNELLLDAALTDQPALFKVGETTFAPRFVHDWKTECAMARKDLKLPEVDRELRTYTQIDRKTGVAMDEKLYSYELVRPDGLTWRSNLDLSDVKDTDTVKAAETRATLISELAALLNESPLLFGKTSTRAKVTLTNGASPLAPEPINHDANSDLWIVLLITPALLLDSRKFVRAGRDELRGAYQAIWTEFTCWGQESPLTLVRYFTGESLVGSNYLFNRFQGRTGNYFPHLITDAGSVFVLTSKPEDRAKAQTQLKQLLIGGLPLPQWAVKHFKRGEHNGDYWQNCPFLPQNGYGEIAVNRTEQSARLPEKLGVTAEPFLSVYSDLSSCVAEVLP